MQAKIFNLSGGKEPKSQSLPKEVFGVEENKALIAEAIKVFLANQRRSHAKAKTRGEVNGSGKKIWRQKGTGRARHGDRYAPIFVGGGVAHGPTGEENWRLSFSQKKRAKALAVSLSGKFKEGKLIFIDSLAEIGGKTKQANKTFQELLKKAVGWEGKTPPRTLLILAQKDTKVNLAIHNLSWLNFSLVANLNPYQVLVNHYLIIEEKALEPLVKRSQIND